jgi:hypothetical protein
MDRFLLLRQFFQVMKSGFRAANNVQPDPEPIRLPGFANVRKNSLFPVKHTEERRNDKSVGFSKPPRQTRQIFLGLIYQMPKLIRAISHNHKNGQRARTARKNQNLRRSL